MTAKTFFIDNQNESSMRVNWLSNEIVKPIAWKQLRSGNLEDTESAEGYITSQT